MLAETGIIILLGNILSYFVVISVGFVLLTILCLELYLRYLSKDVINIMDARWVELINILEHGMKQFVSKLIIVLFAIWFVGLMFFSNAAEMLMDGIKQYWSIGVSAILILQCSNTYSLYKRIKFNNELNKNVKRKSNIRGSRSVDDSINCYYDDNANLYCENLIRILNFKLENEKEKLSILKSIVPLSIVPGVLNFFFDKSDQIVNANNYIVIFLVGVMAILLYVEIVYKRIREIRYTILKVHRVLQKIDEEKNVICKKSSNIKL